MSKITEARLKGLTRRYRALYPAQKIDWVNFANWLNSAVRPSIIPSSWQVYSHAFKSVCPSVPAIDILKGTKAPSRSEIPPRGSRLRKKSLSPDDMKLISNYASVHHKSGWAKNAIAWLKCGLLTGLRPHEWQFSYLDNEYNLTVDNIKLNETTQSTWSPRVIPLSHLSTEELSMITKWIEKMRVISSLDSNGITYSKFIKGCQQWIHIANKRIWPRRKLFVCLMSARHQFIANLKANNFTPVEIAYIVGHANDLRSYESYGAKSNGTIGVTLPDTTNIPQDDYDQISLKLEKAVAGRVKDTDIKRES